MARSLKHTKPHCFRIDLPCAGRYRLRLAAGDFEKAQFGKIEVFDDSSSLGVLSATAEFTFSSSICNLKIEGRASAGKPATANVYIERVKS